MTVVQEKHRLEMMFLELKTILFSYGIFPLPCEILNLHLKNNENLSVFF